VIHQRDERGPAVRLAVRQPPHLAEGPVDELRAQFGIEQNDAELRLVERGAQPEQLVADEFAARADCGEAERFLRLAIRRRARLAQSELHAGAVVRLPHEPAGPRRLFAIDEKVERRGNADEALHLQAGALGRQIPDRAVEHRPPVVEQNLAAAPRARAMGCPAFVHGLLP
jgi:hypothetical protein